MARRLPTITLASLSLLLVPGGWSARAQESGSSPRIEWRVANPFRLFTEEADTEVHRATFLALKGEDRATPILAAERALAERHPDGWAATMLANTCWNSTRNRYECPAVADYLHPTQHRVLLSVAGIDEGAVDCTWTLSTQSSRGGGSVTSPCSETVAMDVPYAGGGQIALAIGGREIAREAIRVADLLIVGLGDSYASGEGNPDVPVRFSRERSADYGKATKGASETALVGYPARVGPWKQIGDKQFIDANARWHDQACHRSLYSHQFRAALQLAIEDPHRAVTFVGYSCSGAEITQGLFLRYKGHEWVPNPPEVSQISAVAQSQCTGREARAMDLPEAYHIGGRVADLKGGLVLHRCEASRARRIDLVLVSIGGNDVGFSRLVANAILSDESTLRRLGGWFGQVHGFLEAVELLDELEHRYKALNRAFHNILHIPWREADRVILTGYPPLALLEDGQSVCPDGRAGMTVLPDFQLSATKATESGVAAHRLDEIMRASAKHHGWSYAGTHRAQFAGRAVCAGFIENSLSTADDLRIPRFINGRWEPFNPGDWKAYISRQRWFRTPNDAFMTGNFHVSQSLFQKALKLQSLSWFQVMLAATYSGAFHPTAEGQAAMADAVVIEARKVLAKYARATPSSRPEPKRE